MEKNAICLENAKKNFAIIFFALIYFKEAETAKKIKDDNIILYTCDFFAALYTVHPINIFPASIFTHI